MNIQVTLLSEKQFSHKVCLLVNNNKDYSNWNAIYVDNYSNINTAPVVSMMRLRFSGENHSVITQSKECSLFISQKNEGCVTPDIFTFKNASGCDLYGAVFKPLNFNPKSKYPTMLYVFLF
jgi:hypothetical protein